MKKRGKKYIDLNWLLIGLVIALIFGFIVWAVVQQIREHYLASDPKLHELRKILKPVHPVIENLKLFKGDKSYTINKDKVFLCLYDKNGDYYPLNTLVFVLLHEVSHKINVQDVGHTPAFHKIFDDLLNRATKLGIFNPSIPIPEDYCKH